MRDCASKSGTIIIRELAKLGDPFSSDVVGAHKGAAHLAWPGSRIVLQEQHHSPIRLVPPSTLDSIMQIPMAGMWRRATSTPQSPILNHGICLHAILNSTAARSGFNVQWMTHTIHCTRQQVLKTSVLPSLGSIGPSSLYRPSLS